MRMPVGQKQFTEAVCFAFRIKGDEVTTTLSTAGLKKGQHVAKVMKGTSADANLVTIKLNKNLGQNMSVLFQPVTLDCECREESEPTKDTILVRTLKSSNLSVAVNDATFNVFIFGSETIREGSY